MASLALQSNTVRLTGVFPRTIVRSLRKVRNGLKADPPPGVLAHRLPGAHHGFPAAQGSSMQDILEGYAAAATPHLIARYDSLSSEAIYQHVIDLLPRREGKVADIGSATGRDAAWFADKGHHVFAAEPVRELREAGQSLHRSQHITWLDDRLPHLTEVEACGPFDLVTLCGVWQHLPNGDRAIAMPRLAAIMKPGGILVISLRHGPGASGRRVYPASPRATIEMAHGCGLRLLRRRESDSVQPANRALGVLWTWLAFAKDA